ncbi:hypothetical protein K470DRAFT_282108 [Piedraia hortae CBS 480.64]|uniref:Amino acid permease/ SLC12A domain-containing protein n=1 Tax=Piedraia hortae CBS 480.64 TaxID=1314780 RepID=A0A6A7BYU8_9PEZI|nr:hypothetical protein K470DRAFT_282108 [Piedraia hortae CBS 480.64]
MSPTTPNGKNSQPGDENHSLHRGLAARQVSMIAIGGAIGTGLIIGTGSSLAKSGPGAMLVSYSIVGLIVYVVISALGELATWLPEGGFAAYATRFVDPALGFALGYTYWFKYIIVTPNQLTAAALVIQYWMPPEKVNPGVFITIFLIAIIVINYLGIKFFGEIEFVMSSIKVLVLIGLIILCIILAAGGGPNHQATGFKYWHHPGAFSEHIKKGAAGRFLAIWSSMVSAVFAFLGTELVGVTVSEAENPRKNIPRAIRLTFWRILVFYIFLILLLGMIVPYNSDKLIFATKQSSSAAASPFVVAIKIAGIKTLPGFFNACILLFVFSAANSDLYIASRTLHSLAQKDQAPKFLSRTDTRGVPWPALFFSAMFCCLAYMSVSSGSKVVFGYFVNLVSIFGLLTWISILVTHIHFVKARRVQGVTDKACRYVSPFGRIGSIIALAFCCVIALTKNYDVFVGKFDYKNFITGYLGIPLYLIMIFGWKIVKRTKGVPAAQVDLFSGTQKFDDEEIMWKEREAAEPKRHWLYRYTLGLLF